MMVGLPGRKRDYQVCHFLCRGFDSLEFGFGDSMHLEKPWFLLKHLAHLHYERKCRLVCRDVSLGANRPCSDYRRDDTDDARHDCDHSRSYLHHGAPIYRTRILRMALASGIGRLSPNLTLRREIKSK